jgi:hypothetical protein
LLGLAVAARANHVVLWLAGGIAAARRIERAGSDRTAAVAVVGALSSDDGARQLSKGGRRGRELTGGSGCARANRSFYVLAMCWS